MSYYSRRDDRDDHDVDLPTASAQLHKLGKDVHSALYELKTAVDGNVDRKLTEFFAKYENEASKLARDVARYGREMKEVKAALETAGSTGKNGKIQFSTTKSSIARDTPEYQNFFTYLTKGKQADGLDYKTLRTDSESQGGYLVPQVMDASIRKNITETSPVRAHARMRVAHSKVMDVPRRLSLPIGQFEGEAETGPTDQSVYGSEQVTLYRQTVSIPATLDMMFSAAFDLEAEIAEDVAESFAQGEGKNFVLGNGRKGPQGFMTDARSINVPSSTSAAILWDDISTLSGSMKHGQRPWFYFNRKTAAILQGLKSSIGVPIWQPVAGNQPATIFGYPYDSSMIDMDDVTLGAGARPVAFADLYRGYEIFDMVGMNAIRDDITQADKAITKFTFRRYLTGRVLVPEAIGYLTLAA
jgi:HK97 family phage major capsid protein